MSIESVMLSNHLILCCPLLLSSSIFPSIRVFPNESTLHIRLPKHWSFSFSISPSNEYSGLIFFRIDWFDLLAVQGTLESSPSWLYNPSNWPGNSAKMRISATVFPLRVCFSIRALRCAFHLKMKSHERYSSVLTYSCPRHLANGSWCACETCV